MSSRRSRGGVIAFAYDDSGNLLTESDALGNMATHTYDTHGNRISTTDPLGETSTYVYDAGSDSSRLVILDARETDRAPIAEIQMPRRVPHGLHGQWMTA